jgi:predicted DNA-binding transcriptional regulator AlpA
MRPVVSHDDRCAYPEDLCTFGQIRAWLGVSRARAYQVTAQRRFPEPWFTGDDGHVRLWRRADVEHWLDENRPGWRESWG